MLLPQSRGRFWGALQRSFVACQQRRPLLATPAITRTFLGRFPAQFVASNQQRLTLRAVPAITRAFLLKLSDAGSCIESAKASIAVPAITRTFLVACSVFHRPRFAAVTEA